MDLTLILLKQLSLMFILVAIGLFLFKTGIITLEASKSLASLIIRFVIPCTIFKSFLVERTPERIWSLFIGTVGSAAILFICGVVSKFFFKKDSIATFAATFSNPGFFGVPLIAASFSESTLFHVAMYIALLNMMQWTWGVSVITGHKSSVSLKRIITAPFMIAIIAGAVFFFAEIPLPAAAGTILDHITGLSTPISMFLLGIYLSQANIKTMFARKQNYRICAVRLLLLPFLSMLLMLLIPSSFGELRMALLLVAACPVGFGAAIYAQLYDKDYAYAVETVTMSAVLSIISIPFVIFVAEKIMQSIPA